MTDQDRIPILLSREQAEQELIKQVRHAAMSVPRHLWQNKHLAGIWQALLTLQHLPEDAIAAQLRAQGEGE